MNAKESYWETLEGKAMIAANKLKIRENQEFWEEYQAGSEMAEPKTAAVTQYAEAGLNNKTKAASQPEFKSRQTVAQRRKIKTTRNY